MRYSRNSRRALTAIIFDELVQRHSSASACSYSCVVVRNWLKHSIAASFANRSGESGGLYSSAGKHVVAWSVRLPRYSKLRDMVNLRVVMFATQVENRQCLYRALQGWKRSHDMLKRLELFLQDKRNGFLWHSFHKFCSRTNAITARRLNLSAADNFCSRRKLRTTVRWIKADTNATVCARARDKCLNYLTKRVLFRSFKSC